jgi:hypothetical protein
VTETPGDAFGRLRADIAGRAATAVTLVNDRDSRLAASVHALIETAKDVSPLLAAMGEVLGLADEFDAEDGHVPAFAGLLRPASRGDRVRRAVLVGIIGEDGINALLGSS